MVADAVRVVAGNVDRQSNKLEIARDGMPLFDKFKSLGLFGTDKNLKWAHVYGTSMQPEGVQDGAYIAYELADITKTYVPVSGDVVLVEIEGEHNNANLHGGYKLRKFVSIQDEKPDFFNEISYDKQGNPRSGVAKLSLIRGKVLFH